MKTIVYTCDVCKQSHGEKEIARLEIKSSGLLISNSRYYSAQVDVCKNCLSKKGIVIEKKESEELSKVELTNEQKLKDIIVSIMVDAGVVFEE